MIADIINFYDGYLDRLTDLKPRHEWVFKSLDRFIPNGKVLDIGCGTGLTSKHLADGGRDVTAIDLSPVLIEYAEVNNNHENIRFMACNVIGFDCDVRFDAIVMVDVMEHILTDSLPKLFNTLKKVSHDKTKIYLNIPHGGVIKFLQDNKPELLQIVDNPIRTGKILKMFSMIGFVPTYFQFYWGQYVEYLFITKTEHEKLLKNAFIKE